MLVSVAEKVTVIPRVAGSRDDVKLNVSGAAQETLPKSIREANFRGDVVFIA